MNAPSHRSTRSCNNLTGCGGTQRVEFIANEEAFCHELGLCRQASERGARFALWRSRQRQRELHQGAHRLLPAPNWATQDQVVKPATQHNGCGCASTRAAALRARASFTTSRGCTLVLSIVPRKSST